MLVCLASVINIPFVRFARVVYSCGSFIVTVSCSVVVYNTVYILGPAADGHEHLGSFQLKFTAPRASVNVLVHGNVCIHTHVAHTCTHTSSFWGDVYGWNCWVMCCILSQH